MKRISLEGGGVVELEGDLVEDNLVDNQMEEGTVEVEACRSLHPRSAAVE